MPTPEENDFLAELKMRQALKQKEMKLVDEITGHFIDKKRLSKRGYVFRGTPKTDQHFAEAAAICRDYDIAPALFVDMAYKRLQKPEFFTPAHLSGTPLRMYIKNRVHSDGEPQCDSNYTITPEELWNYQNEMLKIYTSRGMSADTVLADPGVKFRGWFRIIASSEDNEVIKQKYRELANQELTNTLKEFLVSKSIDIRRITGKK
jgi:hypothetical protein